VDNNSTLIEIKPNRYTKIISGIMLCFVLVFSGINTELFGQEKLFSISFGGGNGFMPLKDVIRFTDWASPDIDDACRSYQFFRKEDYGKFGYLKVAYHIDKTWGTSILFETINISAKGKSTHISIAGIAGTADEDWDFTTVPISVLYEFFIRGRDNRFSPVFGIGPSLYISKMVRKDVFTSSNSENKSFSEIKETQIGYGLLLFFELQSSINDRFILHSRFQVRLAKGMHINDKQAFNSYDVDFTGVDFTLGFGWRF